MRVAIAAVVAVLAFPSAAMAGKVTFGSALTAPANKTEAYPVDTEFWLTKLPGGAVTRAPARGKIGTIKLKGHIVKHGSTQPVTLFHFQILHPTGDGRLRVSLTSGNFHLPVGGDGNRITTYHPINLCAKKGDYVSFAGVGGYKPGAYPNGTPYRIFSNVPAATTGFFKKSGGINNGNVFTPKNPHQGEELLMRMVDLTGDDAGYCKNH
jgi:hypothetical protein